MRHHHRGERGSIIVLSALVMTVVVLAAAFAVDIAHQSAAKRDLHKIADIAAQDALFALGSSTTANCAGANTAVDKCAQMLALASAIGNGVPLTGAPTTAPAIPGGPWTTAQGDYTVTSQVGVWNIAPVTNGSCGTTPRGFAGGIDASQVDESPTCPDVPDADADTLNDATAVMVTVTQVVHNFIQVGSNQISATAVARVGQAGVQVGTFGAQAQTQADLNNKILSTLLGTPETIDLLGYQGLASGAVTVGQLQAAGGFATPEDLLNANMTIGQFFTLVSKAYDPSGTSSSDAAVSLRRLAADASSSSTTQGSTQITPGQFVSVGGAGAGTAGASGSANGCPPNVLPTTTSTSSTSTTSSLPFTIPPATTTSLPCSTSTTVVTGTSVGGPSTTVGCANPSTPPPPPTPSTPGFNPPSTPGFNPPSTPAFTPPSNPPCTSGAANNNAAGAIGYGSVAQGNAQLNLLNLVMSAPEATLINGQSVLSMTLPASFDSAALSDLSPFIPGLGSVNSTLAFTVINAPSVGYGPVGTEAQTAQIRAELDLGGTVPVPPGGLGLPIPVSFNIPILLEGFGGLGTITQIDCGNLSGLGTPDEVDITASPSVGTAAIGSIPPTSLTSSLASLTSPLSTVPFSLPPVALISVGGVATVSGSVGPVTIGTPNPVPTFRYGPNAPPPSSNQVWQTDKTPPYRGPQTTGSYNVGPSLINQLENTGQVLNDVMTTAGSNVVVSASADFSGTDVGDTFQQTIPSSPAFIPSGAKIASIIDSHTAMLTTTATATNQNGSVTIGRFTRGTGLIYQDLGIPLNLLESTVLGPLFNHLDPLLGRLAKALDITVAGMDVWNLADNYPTVPVPPGIDCTNTLVGSIVQ